MSETDWLVRAARKAQVFLGNQAAANSLNGPNDDILIGRELTLALEAFADVPADDGATEDCQTGPEAWDGGFGSNH